MQQTTRLFRKVDLHQPQAAPRYRLPSEDDDDDAFSPDAQSSLILSTNTSSNRGIKRSRQSSDDEVFFRPRARLASDATPQFPSDRLPSDSDCSSVFYPRHRRFRGRENQVVPLQPPLDSSSIQLSSSQYTADDTPDPAFKTPYHRPLRRIYMSSEMSSVQSDSSSYGIKMSRQPPRITRTPFDEISPNPFVSHGECMIENSVTEVRQCLFNRPASCSSLSDCSFLLPAHIPGTSTPARSPSTSSPREADDIPNLAHSILSEELRSDSGISSLPSFDGQMCFSDYRKNFGEKLVDVMVGILNKVDPPLSTIPDNDPATYPGRQSVLTPSPAPTLPDTTPRPLATDYAYVSSRLESSSEILFNPPQTRASSSLDVSTEVDLLSSLMPPHLISPTVISSVPTLTSLSSIDASCPTSTFRTRKKKKKPAQCKVCHKFFMNSSNLKVHMRLHTGECPWVCSFCLKEFSDRSNFRRHKRMHSRKPVEAVCRVGLSTPKLGWTNT